MAIDRSLLALLHLADKFAEAYLNSEQDELTALHITMLKAIDHDAGLPQARLEILLGLDRSRLSESIDDLRRRGLVSITRSTGDRRCGVCRLTSKGQRVLSNVLPILEAASRDVV